MLKRLLSRIKGGGLEEEVAVVSQSMVVSGNLAAPQQIFIEGRVEGDVTCGTLVQRAGGTVVGKINADRVRVGGTIRGDIVAGAVSLQSTGRVIGDITYDALLMAAGSRVDGRLCRRGDLSEHMGGEAELAPTVSSGVTQPTESPSHYPLKSSQEWGANEGPDEDGGVRACSPDGRDT